MFSYDEMVICGVQTTICAQCKMNDD